MTFLLIYTNGVLSGSLICLYFKTFGPTKADSLSPSSGM